MKTFINLHLHQYKHNRMNRLIIIFGIFISLFSMTARAEETVSKAEVHRNEQKSNNTGIQRIPAHLPVIYIISDSETRSIKISCDEDHDVVVWLYDAQGNVVDSSDILNTILYAPDTGNHVFHISIESYNWYATASISFPIQ